MCLTVAFMRERLDSHNAVLPSALSLHDCLKIAPSDQTSMPSNSGVLSVSDSQLLRKGSRTKADGAEPHVTGRSAPTEDNSRD